MLVVSVDDAVPQKACDYLNKLTEVYVAYGVEQKNEDTQNSLKFIDQQLSIITNELLDSEGKLEKYKTENSIFDIAGSATLSQEDIARIENDLSTIEVRNALLKYLDDYIRKGNNVKYISPAYVDITEPILQGLLVNLSTLQTSRENDLKVTTEDNPMVQSKNIQIENIKAQILEKIKSLKDVNNINKLETLNQLSKAKAKISMLPREEKELSSIVRQATITENLFTYLLQKRAETAIVLASSISDCKVIDSARTITNPIKPEKGIIYTLALIFGLIWLRQQLFISEKHLMTG